MAELVVVAYATDPHEASVLINSLTWHGYNDPVLLGAGQTWVSFVDKFQALKTYLAHTDPEQLIMFLDAYDTVVYTGVQTILDLYTQHFAGKVVFNAEVNCWPDDNLRTLYPECSSPYKHLNGGALIGPAGLIHNLIKDVQPETGRGSDQRIWTKLFLQHPDEIAIDSGCVIFQTICKNAGIEYVDGVLYNPVTNTYPAIVHSNGGGDIRRYARMKTELGTWAAQYQNTVQCHTEIVDRFKELVNASPDLKAHRDFVERHVYGFGERSFHWMWKLLVDEMPPDFNFVEVGVYKGQVISLVRLLCNMRGVDAHIHGITPLSSFSGDTDKFSKFPETDYRQHIVDLHNEFGLQFDPDTQLIVGDSTDSNIVARAQKLAPFDIAYVDGCHEYDYVVRDLLNYGAMVKPGGYLVIDDSANFLKMPFGYFTGIEDVSRAVADTIELDNKWHPVITVMHNRVFRKLD